MSKNDKTEKDLLMGESKSGHAAQGMPASTQKSIDDFAQGVTERKASEPVGKDHAKTSKEKPSLPADNRHADIFMRHEQEVMHHLFKLEPATMVKNVSWQKNSEIPMPIEHCHFFHNVDKSGRKLKSCNPVGGHYHLVTWKIVDGRVVAECGPAVYKVGRGVAADKHTHGITYHGAEKFLRGQK